MKKMKNNYRKYDVIVIGGGGLTHIISYYTLRQTSGQLANKSNQKFLAAYLTARS